MRYKKTFMLFLISIIFLNMSLIYANNINESNSMYFRMHVVANSNGIDDQLLKYTIAKEVNTYIKEITKSCKTKSESKQIVKENIQNILNICNAIIKENNVNYTVKAYMGKIMYSDKQSDDIYMKSGIYDSLKIILGKGKGQNWWSLIYPTTLDGSVDNILLAEDTKFSLGIIELIKSIF